MSGGHFDYEDARALSNVIETLAEDIGRHENAPEYYGNDAPDLEHIAKVKILLGATKILKRWLHDYDWQCSGDSHEFDASTESALAALSDIGED